MYSSIVLSLLLWISATLAQSTTTTLKVVTFCKTSYGPSSVANPPTSSSTFSENASLTVTTTFTPIRTVTPAPYVWTRTIRTFVTTSTTIPSPKRSIVTSTYTQYSTATLVYPKTTVTVLDFATYEADVIPTITINGAPSFSPVRDTLPGATPGSPQKRSPRPWRIPPLEPRQNAASSYAQQVSCVVISKRATITVVPATASTSRLTIAQSTTTSRVTEVVTSTRTWYSPTPTSQTEVLVTVTYTTSRLLVDTYTNTRYEGTTTTVIYSVTSAYPQCSNTNGAYTVSSLKVQGFEAASPTGLNTYQTEPFGTSRGPSCCVACLEDPDCAVSFQALQPGGFQCVLISRSNGICDAANPLLMRVRIGNDSDPQGHPSINSIWNNKCGKWVESVQI